MRALLALPVVLAVLALSACGSDEAKSLKLPTVTRINDVPPPPNSGRSLSEKDAFVVGVARAAADVHCRTGRITETRLRETVEDLITLARAKPDDIGVAFKGERPDTPRHGLQTVAERLERDRCAPAVSTRVRAVLRDLR